MRKVLSIISIVVILSCLSIVAFSDVLENPSPTAAFVDTTYGSEDIDTEPIPESISEDVYGPLPPYEEIKKVPIIENPVDRIELKKLNTHDCKFYKNKDGSITAELTINPEPQIDNSLTKMTGARENFYHNKNNRFKSTFPEKLKNNLLHFSYKGNSVSVDLKERKNADISASKNGSKIRYEKVLDKVDINYQVVDKGVKEEIIIEDATAPNEISFIIKTGTLTWEKGKNGRIDFYSDDKEDPLLFLNPISVVTAQGEQTDAVTVNIKKDDNGCIEYTLKIDKEKLAEKDYPLTIDPTITIAPNEQESMDTYIQSRDEPSSGERGQSQRMYVGRASRAIHRGLIKFDLSSLPQGNISSAYLKLSGKYPTQTSIRAYQITTEWLEREASYNNAKDNESWNNRGGDYISPYYTFSQSGSFESYTFTTNIAALVTKWLKGTSPNYGVLLKASNEDIDNVDEDNHQFYMTSGTLIVNYTADTTSPTVSITSPAKNSTLSGSVNISANASDASPIDRVEFYANNELLGTVNQSPYQLSWNTGMYPNGQYTLKAKAYDLAGNEGQCTDTNYNVTVSNLLAAPAGLTASLNGSNHVELHWNPVNIGRVTYNIYRDTTSIITPSESQKIAGASGDNSYIDQSPLNSGVAYYYRVTAVKDDTGEVSAPSNEVSIIYNSSIKPPSALSASSDSSGINYLNWTASPTQPCSYNIYRDIVSGFSPSVDKKISTVASTTYADNDPGLVLDTVYYYLVTALVPDNSESAASNEAAVKCGASMDESGKRLGIKSFYSYAQVDVPRSDSMVNLGNGNLVVSYTDSLIPGNKLVSSIRRTYNSMDQADGVFGWGWSANVTQGLTINPDNSVTFSHGDGYQETFSYIDGAYQAQAGSYLRLSKNADNTYDIYSRENITYHFDTSGNLITIKDLNNNTITYNYTGGKLSSITDTAGRNTNFSYNASNRISSITDARGTPTTYTYDGSGNLSAVTDPKGYVTRFYYDQDHNITRLTSPAGSEQNFSYDNDGRVVSTTDGLGHPTYYEYDMVNGLTTVTDANGSANSFNFAPDTGVMTGITDALAQNYSFDCDSNFNPTSITNPAGVTTNYTYDTMGNMLTKRISDGSSSINFSATYNSLNLPLTLTQPDNTTFKYSYDSYGNLTSVIDAMNYNTSYQYDTKGRRTRTTDPRSKANNYSYDSSGNLTSITDANSKTTTFNYNNVGIITSMTDALNNTTTYEYDILGRLIKINNPDGSSTSSKINGENRLTMSTGPLGEKISYSYDGAGRLIRLTDPRGKHTTYSYDAVGNLLSETDPENVTVTNSYDDLNRLIGVTDKADNSYSFYYDSCGNMVDMVDPLGHALYQTYDYLNRKTASGRRTSHNGANQNQTTYAYDSMGNLISQTDPLNNTTTYQYNNNGWLTSATDALDNTTSYIYDSCKNLTSSQDALNNTTSYTYDNVGNVLTETLPDNTRTAWTYDALNRIAVQTDALNHITKYEYDSMGRLTQKTYHSSPTGRPLGSVAYSYDKAGQRTRMVDSIGTSTYQYDLNGNLTKLRDCLGREVTYSYDDANRRTNLGTSFGAVNYEYDNTGKIEAITDFKGNRITFTYDADGKATCITYPQGGTAVYVYNDLDQMASFDYTLSANSYNRASFQYDSNGNCTNISQQRNDNVNQCSNTNTFTYDAVNRLAQSTFFQTVRAPLYYEITYTYDAAGNRIKYLYDDSYDTEKNITYTYNNTNSLTNENDARSAFKNAYVYDANGNQTKVITTRHNNGHTYPAYTVTRTYDRENRLTEVNNLNEHTNQTDNSKFYYNGDGQLMKVIRTATGDNPIKDSYFYLYDGDQVIADLDGANAVIACYTRTGSGQMLSMYNTAENLNMPYINDEKRGTFYAFCDRLGTVMGIYGKDSGKSRQERYESYGFNNGSNDLMRFSFTGAPYFSEVGLYQMGARYYNPDIGRFITRDTYRGDIYKPWTQNLYTYCNNNPVNYVDPTGHNPITYNEDDSWVPTGYHIDDGRVVPNTSNIHASSELINFICSYEGFEPMPYYATSNEREQGIQTVGFGHLIQPGENFDNGITYDQAMELLRIDLIPREENVKTLTQGVTLNQNQFDALVDFQYNTNGLDISELLTSVRSGNASNEQLLNNFLNWTRQGDDHLINLYQRRYDEWEIFTNGEYIRNEQRQAPFGYK